MKICGAIEGSYASEKQVPLPPGPPPVFSKFIRCFDPPPETDTPVFPCIPPNPPGAIK